MKPIQIFTKPHSPRKTQFKQPFSSIDIINLKINQLSEIIKNSNSVSISISQNGLYTFPKLGAAIPLMYNYYVTVDPMHCILKIVDSLSSEIVFFFVQSCFCFVSNITVSNSGQFLAISFHNGKVIIYQIEYQSGIPNNLIYQSCFSFSEPCLFSALFSYDFICVSVYTNHIIIWNYSTQLRQYTIDINMVINGILTDDFLGVFTVFSNKEIVQYSMNGKLLHSILSKTNIVCSADAVVYLSKHFKFEDVEINSDTDLISLATYDGSNTLYSPDDLLPILTIPRIKPFNEEYARLIKEKLKKDGIEIVQTETEEQRKEEKKIYAGSFVLHDKKNDIKVNVPVFRDSDYVKKWLEKKNYKVVRS